MSLNNINLQQFLTCKQKVGKKSSKQQAPDGRNEGSERSSSERNSRKLQGNGAPTNSMRFSSPKMLSILNTPMSQQKLIFNLKQNAETVEIAASQCPEAIRSSARELQQMQASTTQRLEASMLQSPNLPCPPPLSCHNNPQTIHPTSTNLNLAQIIDIEVQATSLSLLQLLQILDPSGPCRSSGTGCLTGTQRQGREQQGQRGIRTVREVLSLAQYFGVQEDKRVEQWCRRVVAESPRIAGELIEEANQAPSPDFVSNLIQICDRASQNDTNGSQDQKLLKQVTWTARMDNLTEKVSKPFTIQQAVADKIYDIQAQIRVVKDSRSQRYEVFLEQSQAPEEDEATSSRNVRCQQVVIEQPQLQKRQSRHKQRNASLSGDCKKNLFSQVRRRRQISTSQNMNRIVNLGDWNVNTSISLKRHNSLKYQQSLQELKKQINRPIQSRFDSKMPNIQSIMTDPLPLFNYQNSRKFNLLNSRAISKSGNFASQLGQDKRSGKKKKDFLVPVYLQQLNGKGRRQQNHDFNNFIGQFRSKIFNPLGGQGHHRSKSQNIERKPQARAQLRRTRSRNAHSVNERTTMAAGQSLFSAKNMLINYKQIVQHGKNSQLHQTSQSLLPSLGLKATSIGKSRALRKRRHTHAASLSPQTGLGRSMSACNAASSSMDLQRKHSVNSNAPIYQRMQSQHGLFFKNNLIKQMNLMGRRKRNYRARTNVSNHKYEGRQLKSKSQMFHERNASMANHTPDFEEMKRERNVVTHLASESYKDQRPDRIDLQKINNNKQRQCEEEESKVVFNKNANSNQVDSLNSNNHDQNGHTFRTNKNSQRSNTAANSDGNVDEQNEDGNAEVSKFLNAPAAKNVHQSLISQHSEDEGNGSARNSKVVILMQPHGRPSQEGTTVNFQQSLEQNQSQYTYLTSNQLLELPAVSNSELKTICTKTFSENGRANHLLNFMEMHVDLQQGSTDKSQSFKDVCTMISMIQAQQAGYFCQKIGSLGSLEGSTNLHINLMLYSSRNECIHDNNMMILSMIQSIHKFFSSKTGTQGSLDQLSKASALNPAQLQYFLKFVRALNITEQDKDSFLFKTIVLTLFAAMHSDEKIMNRSYFNKVMDQIKWQNVEPAILQKSLDLLSSSGYNNVWAETLKFLLTEQLSILDCKHQTPNKDMVSFNQYQKIENLNTSQLQERMLRRQYERPQIFINLSDVISSAQLQNTSELVQKRLTANQQQSSVEKQQAKKPSKKRSNHHGRNKNKENFCKNASGISAALNQANVNLEQFKQKWSTFTILDQVLPNQAKLRNTSKHSMKKLRKNVQGSKTNRNVKQESTSVNKKKEISATYQELLEQHQLSKSKTKLKSSNKLVGYIRQREKEQVNVRHNSLTGQEGANVELQQQELPIEGILVQNRNTIGKLDHIKLKDLKKIKSKYQQRIKQNKQLMLPNNLQASMDFASPRQSKLHLISVAQSNQNLVDQPAGLELANDHKQPDEDFNASSYKLSKIQSEIQLLQVNKTQSTCNLNETSMQNANTNEIMCHVVPLLLNSKNCNQNWNLTSIERQQTGSVLLKPQNQNQLTFNNLNFMNDQDASKLSEELKMYSSSQYDPSLLPESEGMVNKFHGNSYQNTQSFLERRQIQNQVIQQEKDQYDQNFADFIENQLQSTNGQVVLNEAAFRLYPVVSLTSGQSSVAQNLKNNIITPKPSANPSFMFMSNQCSNMMPTKKKDFSQSLHESQLTPGINTISPQAALEEQQPMQTQDREINNLMPLVPQKILSYPDQGARDSKQGRNEDKNSSKEDVAQQSMDTVLHTKEDEEQRGSLNPVLKKNIIINQNLQQVVKNFDKNKGDKLGLQEYSNHKEKLNNQPKVAEMGAQADQSGKVSLRPLLQSRAAFKLRSKSVNIRQSNSDISNLINQSDNIRQQLRQKYRIVSNTRQNSTGAQRGQRNSKNNREAAEKNNNKAKHNIEQPRYKKTRNSTSYDTSKIKPVLLPHERELTKQKLTATLRVGTQGSNHSGKKDEKRSSSSKYQKMFQKQNKTQRKSQQQNQSLATSQNKQENLILSNEAIHKFSQSTNHQPNQTPDIQLNQRDQSINERIAMSILNSPNSYGSNARSIMNRTFQNQRDNQPKQVAQVNGKFICAPHQQTTSNGGGGGQQTPFQFQYYSGDNKYWQQGGGFLQHNIMDQRRNTVGSNIVETQKSGAMFNFASRKQSMQIHKNQKGLNTQQHPTSRLFDRSNSMQVNGNLHKTNLNLKHFTQDGIIQLHSEYQKQRTRDQSSSHFPADNFNSGVNQVGRPFKIKDTRGYTEDVFSPIELNSNFEKSLAGCNLVNRDFDDIEIQHSRQPMLGPEQEDEHPDFNKANPWAHNKEELTKIEQAIDHNFRSDQIHSLHVRASELESTNKQINFASKVFSRKSSVYQRNHENQMSRNEPNNILPSADFKGFDNKNHQIDILGSPGVSPLPRGHSHNEAMLNNNDQITQKYLQDPSNTHSDILNLFQGLNGCNTGRKNVHEKGSSTFQDERSQLAVERVNHFLQKSLMNSSSNKQQLSFDENLSEGKEMIQHLLYNSFQNQRIMNAHANKSNVTSAAQKIISPSELSLSDNTQLILGVMGLGNGTNISNETKTLSRLQNQISQNHVPPSNPHPAAMTSFHQQSNSFQNSDQGFEIGKHLAQSNATNQMPSKTGSIKSNEECRAMLVNFHSRWPGLPQHVGDPAHLEQNDFTHGPDEQNTISLTRDHPMMVYCNAQERKAALAGAFKQNGDIDSLLTDSLDGPYQQRRARQDGTADGIN